MTKVRCFKCKGKGFVREKTDLMVAVLTFGMSALIDKSQTHTCNACGGKGYLEE